MHQDPSLIPATVGPRFKRHDGSAPGPDDDFILLPDPNIGEVLSACTNRTLRGFQKGTGGGIGGRIALGLLGALFGGLLGMFVSAAGMQFLNEQLELGLDRDIVTLVSLVGAAGAGLFAALIGFFIPLVFRFPLVTYVGRHGVMRYVKPKLGSARREVMRFVDADEVKVSRTRRYYNGGYVGTMYDYNWLKAGRSVFRINGQYHDKRVGPMEPVNFAFAAERAWTRYRLEQVQEQMRRDGIVRFRAGNDWIGVGPGFIELGWRGAVERLDKAQIQALQLQSGTLIVKRHGAKEGLFRSEGVFRFPVSAMSDFHTFLVALEASTGYHFD